MKNLAPAALVALAIVAASLLTAHAQQQPAPGAAAVFDTYAVDSFNFAESYTMGREIDQVWAGTVCGEPFVKGKPGQQLVGLAQLLAARGKQGYTLVSYFEGSGVEFPKDGHYTSDTWKSHVRLVWGKKG
jgi:hypothetical protein